MFQKLKASLGIGAAKVDTVLENSSILQGDVLKGNIHIVGGDVEQQVDAINLKLCTEVKIEDDNGISYQHFVLDKIQALEPFLINANEIKQFPFELKLNDETPITSLNARKNQCRVWLETALDIDFALDPKDRDLLQVRPLPVVEKVITAIERGGFNIVKADVEKGYLRGGSFSSKSGCYQEIEFKNTGLLSAKEIELSFVLEGGVVHCLAEVDRKFGLRGDQYHSFTLGYDADDRDVASAVQSILAL
ncbi:sporulation protein [Microbulbifer sp. GL-2]|uniref:sporulation protein n=1 Tax=Microbulbifer sp. GL-2 TaxID=2591606 RepID=UPI001164B62D|nr:sporulation protein [Microbulbifer sp. GL-2]BBM03177.1 sporulation-control protein [Microbulbifer sp. GL-2]